MKKLTRKEKRDQEKEINFFKEFLKLKKHFFKHFEEKLRRVKDPRNKSYIEYSTELILFLMILKNACGIFSMNNMTDSFNKDECIENIAKTLGYDELKELPHYDTINNFLCDLDNEELEQIRKYMIQELLKKRCLEDYRLRGKYWCIAIDATGLFSFKKRHCEHCLTKEYKNKETGEVERTIYYHNVLEAKLVVGKMVFSMETEFIENEKEGVSKQDCELKAFKRLAKKLKKNYPRLPICILGDSLYASETVFKICDNNNWKFLIRFKEGSIKSVASEFTQLKDIDEKNFKMSQDEKIKNKWVNGISYNERLLNAIESVVKEDLEKDEVKTFVFITNISITKKNCDEIVWFGRSRWKIENQGFRNQKVIRYKLEHANSLNYNAMKNHYLLVQIADILRQLFEKGVEKIKVLGKSLKEISSRLLESFRTCMITAEDIITRKRMKIRLL